MRLPVNLACAFVLSSLCSSTVSAAPAITNLANAASNMGYNYPIAQGSIFVIYGTGLGPANISISSSPFQSTSLSGTSVSVTVGSTTVNAPMYYTSDTQVAALLPSNLPDTGSGSFTVTYNGQTSAPHVHGVTANDVGIFTIDSSGQGAAIVTYPDYSLVSPVKAANCGGPNTTCGAANPGDVLTIWATGLGPVNGSDASGAGLGQNMPGIPLTVWLGGVQAQVSYQGRSGCCIGEDQIVFTVPNTVPTGCGVPLSVQIGSLVSNSGLIAVANGSRDCTPVNPTLAAVGSTAAEQLFTSGAPLRLAQLNLIKQPNGNGTGYVNLANFMFFEITSWTPGTQPFLATYFDDPPVGTCVVYTNTNGNNDVPATGGADLNAGSSFTVTGPVGAVNVPPISVNSSAGPTTIDPTGAFLQPGNYTISGTGGSGIPAFTEAFSFEGAPTPTAPANNATVTRANGLNVTWTTGSSGNIRMQVVSATDQTFNNGFTTDCTAPASAGTFTIPAYALLPLLAGGTNTSYFQFYSKQQFPFTVSGTSAASAGVARWGPVTGLVLK